MSPLAAAAREARDAYRQFSPPARRLLASEFLVYTGTGIAQVLFNLYLVEAGLGPRVAGHAVSLQGLGIALGTIPAGLLARRFGRRRTIVLGLVTDAAGQLLRCATLWTPLVYGASLLAGGGQSLIQIAAAPFLAEHSTTRERTHLFSALFAVTLIAAVAGSLIGGWLPRLLLTMPHVRNLVVAYRVALVLGGLVSMSGAAVLGALRLTEAPEDAVARSRITPEARRRLVPIGVNALLIGAGAGLVIPFMNLYFAQRFRCSSAQIGSFFSVAQVCTAVAALLAPALGRRYGKLRTAVASQLLSLPFLLTLGLESRLPLAVGAFWMRAVLMQASTPLLSTFIMESLPTALRTTAMGFTNLTWNVGWSISATVAGLIIQRFGYSVPFVVTAALYATAALYFYSAFRGTPESEAGPRLSEEAKGHRADGP